ncbi:dCTP deaminase domain-containing protein [Thermococcus siculi]|nr:hypothetical protein [Thermococcus siculi]
MIGSEVDFEKCRINLIRSIHHEWKCYFAKNEGNILPECWDDDVYRGVKDLINDLVKNPLQSEFPPDSIPSNIPSPIFLSNFEVDNLGMGNYDLSLGPEVYVTSMSQPKWFSSVSETASIPPGAFALLLTNEYILLPPDVYGLISLRFSHKVKGLTNVSGFHIDPGYCGRILFGVYNAGSGDVYLEYRKPTFVITFMDLGNSTSKLMGIYTKKSYDYIPVEYIEKLRGDPVSLRELDKRVKILETITYVILASFVLAVLMFALQQWK